MVFFGNPLGGFPAGDDLTFEDLLNFGEIEADHIGGVIVLEVLSVDIVDGMVIDDGDGYLAVDPAEIASDRFDRCDDLLVERGGHVG